MHCTFGFWIGVLNPKFVHWLESRPLDSHPLLQTPQFRLHHKPYTLLKSGGHIKLSIWAYGKFDPWEGKLPFRKLRMAVHRRISFILFVWTESLIQLLKDRQSRNYFFKPKFLPKNGWTCFRSFFWKKLKTPKRHCEIKWPLACPKRY